MNIGVSEGRPLSLGMHDYFDGFNFAPFSRHATLVALPLFEDAESATPFAILEPRQTTGEESGSCKRRT